MPIIIKQGTLMKKYSLLLSTLTILILTGCNTPSLLGKKVKKTYFTGGQIFSEFIMDDDSGQNGLLKRYGYNGNLTSTVTMRNGVKHGVETGYDEKGRIIWKETYVNGRRDGQQYAFYPNGDIMLSYTYKNGIKNGPAKTYNKDGTINREVMYKNGKLVY